MQRYLFKWHSLCEGTVCQSKRKMAFFFDIICPEVYHNYIQNPNKAAGTDLLTLKDALDIRAALGLSPG